MIAGIEKLGNFEGRELRLTFSSHGLNIITYAYLNRTADIDSVDSTILSLLPPERDAHAQTLAEVYCRHSSQLDLTYELLKF